ncbi:DedA family protein [Telmatospirillum sp.]|uniref:DedA family protein n=1 Tax=Telmatospirillum sp. TaxID=2079197 RepID=UPI00284279BC|nr:DedA family protein [Telmatospirillum sp.]MDR3436288.1 DedA family protein [Telmatospirillum sp.]
MLAPWIHHYGVAAVFFILTLESCGLPLPGESLLIVSAMLAGHGDFSFSSLFFSAWAGAVFGDNIGYWIGRKRGNGLLLRYGGRIGLNARRIHKAEVIFAHYGPVTVGFARFFTVLRQLNGIIAGTMKMDWQRFLFFNASGGALWVLVWTIVGFYLGAHAADMVALVHKAGFLGGILALVTLITILIYRYRHGISARLRQGGTDKIKLPYTKSR